MFWPVSHLPYTDVYFIRALEILQKSQLNPFVRAQVFVRQGPGRIYGLNEALQVIGQYCQLDQHGGRVLVLEDGAQYDSTETVLVIEGLAQDVITLETMLLGMISAATSIHNDQTKLDFLKVTEQMQLITQLVKDRPVYYFGARHWSFDQDENISRAAWAGGAAGCSTQIGAAVKHHQPVGTIPHSLEAIFAWKYGREKAIVETTLAFDKYMPQEILRIALVDFNNHEIDDSLAVCQVMGDKLAGIRIDTCGENVMQGGRGKGVSVEGVVTLRKILDQAGFKKIKITLSSGFGHSDKIKQFLAAEDESGLRLFDSLGVGELFTARTATMDIVGVGDTINNIQPMAKVGRSYQPNKRLKRVI